MESHHNSFHAVGGDARHSEVGLLAQSLVVLTLLAVHLSRLLKVDAFVEPLEVVLHWVRGHLLDLLKCLELSDRMRALDVVFD